MLFPAVVSKYQNTSVNNARFVYKRRAFKKARRKFLTSPLERAHETVSRVKFSDFSDSVVRRYADPTFRHFCGFVAFSEKMIIFPVGFDQNQTQTSASYSP